MQNLSRKLSALLIWIFIPAVVAFTVIHYLSKHPNAMTVSPDMPKVAVQPKSAPVAATAPKAESAPVPSHKKSRFENKREIASSTLNTVSTTTTAPTTTAPTTVAPVTTKAPEIASSSSKGNPPKSSKPVQPSTQVVEPDITTVAMRAALAHAKAGGTCAPIDFRGQPPQQVNISTADWKTIQTQFSNLKQRYLNWITYHHAQLGETAASFMENQLRSLEIERPPSSDEPDLSWRGIGVWTVGPKNQPRIHLGAGFVRLETEKPERAQFELARLIAQTWAPCELARAGVGDIWDSILSCLQIPEAADCAEGSFSEGGWAISTGLAWEVSPPDCVVPAFEDPTDSACLKSVRTTHVLTSMLETEGKKN